MISLHDRIISDYQWHKNCGYIIIALILTFARLVSFWQTESVWQASTWLSRGNSRRVLSRLRPFKPPLRTPAFLAQGVCVSWFPTPPSSVLSPFHPPCPRSPGSSTFFSSFFFIQLFPHSMAPVVSSSSGVLRLAGRISFLGNAWIERWRCACVWERIAECGTA